MYTRVEFQLNISLRSHIFESFIRHDAIPFRHLLANKRIKCFKKVSVHDQEISQKPGRRVVASKMPGGYGCCPFKGDSSVFVYSLFYVPPIASGGSIFGPCFVMHYFMSFVVLQSS